MTFIIKLFILLCLFCSAFAIYSADTFKPTPKIKTTQITPCLYKGMWCKSVNTQHEVAILFPKKITYLKPFTVQVKVPIKQKIKKMKLQFSMQGMQMVANRFTLKQIKEINNNQIWQTEVVIPMCSSGRKDWLIELGVRAQNKVEKSNFLITVW